jgi:hypothetical protein
MQRPIHLDKRGHGTERSFGKLSSARQGRFSPGRSDATARAGGIANPLLRAISSDLESFIRQHLSLEDTVAVPIPEAVFSRTQRSMRSGGTAATGTEVRKRCAQHELREFGHRLDRPRSGIQS